MSFSHPAISLLAHVGVAAVAFGGAMFAFDQFILPDERGLQKTMLKPSDPSTDFYNMRHVSEKRDLTSARSNDRYHPDSLKAQEERINTYSGIHNKDNNSLELGLALIAKRRKETANQILSNAYENAAALKKQQA